MSDGIRIHAFLNGYEVLRAPHAWIETRRHAPLSRGGITLPDPKGELYRSIFEGAPIEIRSGHRGENPVSWKGTISWKKRGTTPDQVEFGAVGVERILSQFKVTQAFENETPEAILNWCLARAGLPAARIDAPGVVFPRFIASDLSLWQVAESLAQTCTRQFGIDTSKWAFWMDAEGRVNWGDFEETPGVAPVIETGGFLIRHEPASDSNALNRVETFLLPAFRANRLFLLRDQARGIDAKFRALAVRHQMEARAARTLIEFGVEHGRH